MDDNAVQRRIGQHIRLARLQARITQQELAAALGLTRSSVSNIEAGTQALSLLTFLKIAQALVVAPSDLLNGVAADVDLPGGGGAAGLPDYVQSMLDDIKRDDVPTGTAAGART